jgi:hypothetical protein
MSWRLAILLVSPMLAVQPALAREYAIAHCFITHHTAVGSGPDVSSAKEAARSACIAIGGDPRCCAPMKWTGTNVPCIGYAHGQPYSQDKTGDGYSGGDTRSEAAEKAVSACSGIAQECKIVGSYCRN